MNSQAFTSPSIEQPTHSMMAMSLWTKIATAEHLSLMATGNRPTHIYLGQGEKEIILCDGMRMYKAGDEKKTRVGICKNQLAGMELHFVEDESYFKVF